jgi:hypothetical protein
MFADAVRENGLLWHADGAENQRRLRTNDEIDALAELVGANQ